jgi:hypothetical protein
MNVDRQFEGNEEKKYWWSSARSISIAFGSHVGEVDQNKPAVHPITAFDDKYPLCSPADIVDFPSDMRLSVSRMVSTI